MAATTKRGAADLRCLLWFQLRCTTVVYMRQHCLRKQHVNGPVLDRGRVQPRCPELNYPRLRGVAQRRLDFAYLGLGYVRGPVRNLDQFLLLLSHRHPQTSLRELRHIQIGLRASKIIRGHIIHRMAKSPATLSGNCEYETLSSSYCCHDRSTDLERYDLT
jgi:hypothetical protein